MNKDQIAELVQVLQTNRKVLKSLKTACVDTQEYNLAANLREMEVVKFPIPKEYAEEVEEAKALEVGFRAMGFDANIKGVWMIRQMFKAYDEGGGDADLKDVRAITTKANEIFG